MSKHVVLGIFFASFIAGLILILDHHSVTFGEFIRSLSRLSPRTLGLLAMPFLAAIFIVAIHLRNKSADRMWKKALKDTRRKGRS